MPALYVVGSENLLPEIESIISEYDSLLLVGNKSLLNVYGKVCCFKIHMVALEPVDDSALATDFVAEFTREMSVVEKYHLNNLYYYAVAPLSQVVDVISDIVNRVGINEIVLPTKVGKGWFPLYMTGWGESSRNIMTIIDEFIGPVVVNAFQGRIRIRYMKVSFFPGFRSGCKIFMRSVILIVASTVLQLMKVRPKSSANFRQVKYIFSVRSQHQLNVLNSLVIALGLKPQEYVVLEAEMLSSKVLLPNLHQSSTPYVSVFRGGYAHCACVVSAVYSLGGLIRNAFRRGDLLFSRSGYDLRLSLRGLLIDTWVQPHLLAYRWCLRRTLSCLGISESGASFVSFEQVSPQAMVESDVCRVLGLKSIGIKSTSILPIAHPIISPFDVFLVNDQAEEVAYRDCTVRNKAAIHYSGSPKYSALVKMRSKGQKSSGVLVYATQPHESDSNQAILSVLAQHVIVSGKQLVIRPHPRDVGNYDSFLCSDVMLDSDTRLYELIAGADLLVSRTSTVLEEALYIGTPYLSCCLSEKDRAYCAAYLNPESGLIVDSTEALSQKLNDLSAVDEHFQQFRASYLEGFCCLTRESLEQTLGEEKICVES